MPTDTMEQPKQKMGIWGLPGTFPTGTVLDAIKKSDPDGVAGIDWTRQKVNDIYFWYKEGIDKGQKPWTMQERGIASYISENTNYSQSDTNSFGFAVHQLAQAGEIPVEYWSGVRPEAAPQIADVLPDQKIFLTYAKTVKWVAIAGIVGVGLYFAWPVLTAGRKKLKKRYA